jgi:hypothetical protein
MLGQVMPVASGKAGLYQVKTGYDLLGILCQVRSCKIRIDQVSRC